MEGKMRTFVGVAICVLGAGAGFSQSRSFSGEIMDSPCAAMRTHSRMMAGVGASNAKDCTEKCVRQGAKYALYDPSTQTAYQLDDQQKAAPFAGQKVSIKGTLDAGGKNIHVESVQAQ
jgi:hypothetical protein